MTYKRLIFVAIILAGGLGFWFGLPKPLFRTPLSIVLEDESGQLLGARIAEDEQWRFPLIDSVPQNFAEAITVFEDKRFYTHPGVDIRSIGRALRQNIQKREKFSGASTISMQVIRMARGNRRRTYWQKLLEIILAIRLEISYSKEEILRYYASNAPFGGNIVGLEAASWRYYGKSPQYLSNGEAALLAVLPNNPSLVRPGKRDSELRQKRDFLLDKLWHSGHIDSTTCALSQAELLPGKPLPLPAYAPHLLDRAVRDIQSGSQKQARIRSSIHLESQIQLQQILTDHARRLKADEIHNAAILLLDIETGQAKAYIGNLPNTGSAHGEQVDIIQSNRSTGSSLKPILMGLAIDEGLVTQKSLVKDIPTLYNGYRPQNFNHQYEGVIPLDEGLIKSLNIPFVRLLKSYGIEKFHHHLKNLGIQSLSRPPSHYGLTMAIGGVETSPWQLGTAYANLARSLTHFYDHNGQYNLQDIHASTYLRKHINQIPILKKEPTTLSAASTWQVFETMKAVKRPNHEGHWEAFGSRRPIAWKTGTSIGFRDAWAIGLDRSQLVVVWVGNADGEGRPSLTGLNMAAPILFNVFQNLPNGGWFDPPYDELIDLPICSTSGYLPGDNCPIDTLLAPKSSLNVNKCHYHQKVFLNASATHRVHRGCAEPNDILPKSMFVLNPIESHYYKSYHPDYQPIPPFKPDCQTSTTSSIQIIYPRHNEKIYVPVGLDGTQEKTVFEVANAYPEEKLYWHIDQTIVGTTRHFHSLALNPPIGKHILTVVDSKGNRIEHGFEIVGK